MRRSSTFTSIAKANRHHAFTLLVAPAPFMFLMAAIVQPLLAVEGGGTSNGRLLNECSLISEEDSVISEEDSVISEEDSVSKQEATAILPSSIVMHLELKDSTKLVQAILDHPLRAKIEQIEDVKKAMKSHEYKQINVLRRMLEYQLEMSWQEIITNFTAQGLTVSLDGETEAIAVIAHARDAETLNSMVTKLFELVDDIKKLKIPLEVKESKYRSLRVFEAGSVRIGILDDKLLVTNNSRLAKQIADRFIDESRGALSQNSKYVDSKKLVNANGNNTLFIDLETIREKGIAKELFLEQTENIGVEILLGGLQSNLRQAPFAVVDLKLNSNDLLVSAKTPHQTSWVDESRDYFFGADGKGAAPAMLVPDNALLNLTAHRDFAGLWLSKEDLFDEGHIAELAQADSQLSTFFSGLDFGEEILGAAKPGIQIVSALQDFSKLETPQPNIKLPSFAVIFELENAAEIQRRFKMAFQSVVGLANIGLAQEGQPQLDVETETIENGKIVTTMYVAEDSKDREGLINYNFSPTLAFVDDYLILSSTGPLAKELIGLARKGGQTVDARTNTFAKIDAAGLKQILDLNREVLISQTMLEEGLDRTDAEKQIKLFLSLLDIAKDATLTLDQSDRQIELTLVMRFDDSKSEGEKSKEQR